MQRKLLRYFLAGLMVPLAAGAADVPPLTGAGCEAFGFNFYRKLSATEPYRFAGDANVAISPLSLASVLQAFRLGASGEAEKELTQALQEPMTTGTAPEIVKPGDLNGKSIQFSVGNSLWVDKHFVLKPGFVKTTKKQLDAAVLPADFSQPAKEAARINGWISKHTAGHINDLVKPGSVAGASLTVANAVYFKAAWAKPFEAANTKDDVFNLASGKTVRVPMMNKVAKARYVERNGVKVLEMPYAGYDVSMLLVLPKAGAKGWAAMEEELTEGWFQKTVGVLDVREVTIKVPRWKINCEPQDCTSVLKAAGVKAIFQPSWDLVGISDQARLYVNAFVHRAWMEVNEKGTEAAAATHSGLYVIAAEPPTKPATFVADRPFLFVIRHNATGTPLFVGRVSNPAGPQPK